MQGNLDILSGAEQMRLQPEKMSVILRQFMTQETLEDLLRQKQKIAAFVHHEHVVLIRTAETEGKKRIPGHT